MSPTAHPHRTHGASLLLALAGLMAGSTATAADGPMDHVLRGQARPTHLAGQERPQAWNIAEYSAVRLVPVEAGAGPNQHPQELAIERIERWLSQARLQGGREPLFMRDEVESVAKGLAEALRVARPNQDVILLSSARRSGPLTPMLSITARVFVADGALQLLVQGDRLNVVTPFRAQQLMPALNFGSRALASGVQLQRDGQSGRRSDWLAWPLADAEPAPRKAVATPSPPPSPSASDPAGEASLEARLRRLKALHEQGLISDDDYAQKRRSLLDAL
ncbi:SHOCT domain-containing protein [Leptothrix sp. BB-4]